MPNPTLGHIFGNVTNNYLVNQSDPALITDDHIGLELELENIHENLEHLQGEVSPYWNAVEDGSLRNGGREFVFASPMFGRDILDAFEVLDSLFINHEIAPELSRRTSMHVHLDVRDLSPDQLLTFLLVYLLCEPVFFNVVSPERKYNPYCSPLAEMRPYLRGIAHAFRGGDENFNFLFSHSFSAGTKYTALNVLPVSSQGSVEFRHHQGASTLDEALPFINMCLAIKRWVVNNDVLTVNELDRIANGRIDDFVASVFTGLNVDVRNLPYALYDNVARIAKTVMSMPSGRNRRPVPLIGSPDTWLDREDGQSNRIRLNMPHISFDDDDDNDYE